MPVTGGNHGWAGLKIDIKVTDNGNDTVDSN